MSKPKPEVASKADMVAAYKQMATQKEAFEEVFKTAPDWSDEYINEQAVKVYASIQKQKASSGPFGYNKTA